MVQQEGNTKRESRIENDSEVNLQELSSHILESIVKYLGVSDVFRFRRVSRRLKLLLERSHICQELCLKRLAELNLINQLVLPAGTGWQWLALCLIHDNFETLGSGTRKMLKKSQDAHHRSYGIMKKESGDIYIGEFLDGRMDGKGVYINKSGRVYSGEWKRDMREGAGWDFQPISSMKLLKEQTSSPVISENEDTTEEYWGQWKEDMPNGRGCKFFPGGVYDGMWKNGTRDGHGSIWWSSGSNYQGHWLRDNKQGQGTYTWHSGDKFEGLWNQSRYLEGKYVSFFGSSYQGNHDPFTGIYSGHGRFEHPDGTFWEGEWENGLPSNPIEAYHPELRKAIEERTCTRKITGNTSFYGQVLYMCSCENKIVCESCFKRCHSNHSSIRVFWTIGRSVCNCSCSINITRCLHQHRQIEPSKTANGTEELIEDRSPFKLGHDCSDCPSLPKMPYFYPSATVPSKALKRHVALHRS